MLPTHLHAEKRYEDLRRIALEVAQQGASPGIRFSLITAEALRATTLWMQVPDRRVDWDWVAGYPVFRFRHPKRFELAAWEQGSLMALSLGRPTYNGNHLRLDFVEARPRSLGSRPTLFGDVLVAYGIYARLLNAQQIRIMHPVNAETRSNYESYGYRYVAGHDYLFKELA
jgi:hypothetical protein